MSANKRGLGKGLEALLSSTVNSAKKEASLVTATIDRNKTSLVSGKSVISLDINEISPNPRQPRHSFNKETLEELADSIKEHGVAQPLLVRRKGNNYELVAGERRLRASKLAGLTRVPVIVKDMSDEESLEISIIENIQREDLNAIDEAESYALLMKEFDLTQEEAALKVGKARPSVANALRLLDLPKEIKDSVKNNEISAGHARAILGVGTLIGQLQLWHKVKKEMLSVRDTEKLASKKSVKQKLTEGSNKQKSHSLTNIEQELSSKLSTKVELSGDEQKGSIHIKYFSRDDLDRIYTMLTSGEIV